MAHPDNSGEIEKVQAYVRDAEAVLNGIGIFPRTLTHYPFDRVALEILSKSFALAKSCLLLLVSGYPDEAFGLSRSLVECAINLRYLTQDETKLNSRTDEFIQYLKADKSYWMHYALQNVSAGPKEQRIREHGRLLDVEPDPKAARRHWSGSGGFVWGIMTDDHPLDGTHISEKSRKATYAVEYHYASSFVHCSQPALDNYCPDEKEPFRVLTSTGEFRRSGQPTLFNVLDNLHSVIAYALFGMNFERPDELNRLFSVALDSLLPYNPLHP